jgi:hypothetical protein
MFFQIIKTMYRELITFDPPKYQLSTKYNLLPNTIPIIDNRSILSTTYIKQKYLKKNLISIHPSLHLE